MDDQNKDIPAAVKALVERLAKILQISTTDPVQYDCEICHDTGMVPVTDEDGVVRQARCECYQRKRAERLLKASGLENVIDQQTFDTFIAETTTQQVMKHEAKQYLGDLLKAREEWNPRAPWFYIGGNPGSGKTHICTAICGELLKRNIGVKYMKWVEESKRLKFNVRDENFDDIIICHFDQAKRVEKSDNP